MVLTTKNILTPIRFHFAGEPPKVGHSDSDNFSILPIDENLSRQLLLQPPV
jgi:hypothetical protein